MLWGNTLANSALAVGITLGLLVWIAAVRSLILKKLRLAHQTETDFDDFGVDLAERTKLLLLVLPAVYLGARALVLPADLFRYIRVGAQLSFIAQVVFWCAGLVDFWLRRYRRARLATEPEAVTTIDAFRVAMIVAMWVVAVLFALHNLGYQITTVIAGLGIGGVAVALATQNILADLFASLSIVIDKPFVVGDFIIVGEMMGTVERIGLKTTRVRSLSGEQLIFANADLLQSRIRNYKRMSERRAVFRLGVVYRLRRRSSSAYRCRSDR